MAHYTCVNLKRSAAHKLPVETLTRIRLHMQLLNKYEHLLFQRVSYDRKTEVTRSTDRSGTIQYLSIDVTKCFIYIWRMSNAQRRQQFSVLRTKIQVCHRSLILFTHSLSVNLSIHDIRSNTNDNNNYVVQVGTMLYIVCITCMYVKDIDDAHKLANIKQIKLIVFKMSIKLIENSDFLLITTTEIYLLNIPDFWNFNRTRVCELSSKRY